MNYFKYIIQKQYFTIYQFRVPVNFLKLFRHFCLLVKKPDLSKLENDSPMTNDKTSTGTLYLPSKLLNEKK